jgi:hypothetical protein
MKCIHKLEVCMYVCIYTYYYFLLNTDDIKYTIKTHQDFKFMYVCMYKYDHILHLLTNRAVSAPQGEAKEVPRKPIREESGLPGQNSHLPG